MGVIDEAVERSRELLHRALVDEGFVASPSYEHYSALWARDAAIACLGASRSGDETLVLGTERTLRTLAALMTPAGQVPNAFWPRRGYWDWGESGAVDPTPWLVVALSEHVAATGRLGIATELWPAVGRALTWMEARDVTSTGLVDSAAASDWMDSSLNRSGRVFHVNVLYHWAVAGAVRLAGALGAGSRADPARVAASIEGLFWPTPGMDLADVSTVRYPGSATFPHPLAASEYRRVADPDRRYFVSSVSYGRFVDRCDVLANCLAIVSGLAGRARAALILDYLDETGCHDPFPSRTWPQPFTPDEPGSLLDAHADARQALRWRNPPGSYHNGAVWPYVGAVHACAAAAAGRTDRAHELLEGVAAANALAEWGFHEWLRVPDGSPQGSRDQTWNAGALLWAHSVIAGG